MLKHVILHDDFSEPKYDLKILNTHSYWKSEWERTNANISGRISIGELLY